MRDHRRNRAIRDMVFALSVCICSTAPSLAKQYMTPGFLAKTARPMSLAVLPPHARFIKQQAIMTAEMVKEAQALEDVAATALGTQLRSKGYTVRVLTQNDVAEVPGLEPLVTNLNTRYDEEWSKILHKAREVKEGRYSAGDYVVKICSLLKVEGLIVSRIVAVGNSGGRQAMGILFGVSSQSYVRIGLGVLEGKAGQVEGYFEGSKPCMMKSLLKKPDTIMGNAVEGIIDHYPGSEEIRIVKNAPERPDADVEKSDEAAISDFEAALKSEEPALPEQEAPPASQSPPETPPPAPEKPPSLEEHWILGNFPSLTHCRGTPLRA